MITWLGVYRSGTPGVRVGDNSTARLDIGNVPQPDAVMIIDPRCGGQARIDGDGYLTAAPELAAEVTASSASYDLGAKFDVYRGTGVREYLVWRVEDREVD
jgi:Uma2 family endonuclease